MRSVLIAGAALAATVTVTATAAAANPPAPFPAPKVAQLFVAAQTVTPEGAMSSWFAPGSTSAHTRSTPRRSRSSHRRP
jgi:hypothetical protein